MDNYRKQIKKKHTTVENIYLIPTLTRYRNQQTTKMS